MLAPPFMPLGCMLVPPRLPPAAALDVLPRPTVGSPRAALLPRGAAFSALPRERTADVDRTLDPVLTLAPRSRTPLLMVRSPTSARADLIALRERTPSRTPTETPEVSYA
jgi:hypothetical protein